MITFILTLAVLALMVICSALSFLYTYILYTKSIKDNNNPDQQAYRIAIVDQILASGILKF